MACRDRGRGRGIGGGGPRVVQGLGGGIGHEEPGGAAQDVAEFIHEHVHRLVGVTQQAAARGHRVGEGVRHPGIDAVPVEVLFVGDGGDDVRALAGHLLEGGSGDAGLFLGPERGAGPGQCFGRGLCFGLSQHFALGRRLLLGLGRGQGVRIVTGAAAGQGQRHE